MTDGSVHSHEQKRSTTRRKSMKKLLGHFQKITGIYSLGFDMASFMGIALPVGFVVLFGGGLAAFIIMR